MIRFLGLIAYIIFALSLGLLFPENYYVTVVGNTVFLNIVLAVALNLFMGLAGQVSLGHAAFFGIGAYISAILTSRYGVNPWPAMVAGALITGILSLAISRPILKLKGHYLAMATLGLGIIVHIFLVQEAWLTGGPDGMSDIPALSLLWITMDSDIKWYIFLALFSACVIWMSLNLDQSRAGRALKAIHGSEVAASCLGIDTASMKAQVFILSAVITAIAGSLFVHQQAFVSPDSCSFGVSIEILTMVVLGGLGSTFGAVFGGAFITILPELLLNFDELQVLIYGAILMIVMIFLPKGVFVSLRDLVSRYISGGKSEN